MLNIDVKDSGANFNNQLLTRKKMISPMPCNLFLNTGRSESLLTSFSEAIITLVTAMHDKNGTKNKATD